MRRAHIVSTIFALLLLFSSLQTTLAAKTTDPLGGDPCESEEIATAIGCVPIGSEDDLFGFILGWAIGIAGGIAFVLIIFAGFQIMTSAGDPKRLQAGRELLTSAIAGLMLIIFSTFILRLIGVDILGILRP